MNRRSRKKQGSSSPVLVEDDPTAAATAASSTPLLPTEERAGENNDNADNAADINNNDNEGYFEFGGSSVASSTTSTAGNNGDHDDDDNTGTRQRRLIISCRRLLYLLSSPLTDDQGRQPLAIVMGLLGMALGGTLLGVILPKSADLPSHAIISWLPSFLSVSYRTISSCIGYTYFLSWSVSFYPQLLQNFRRKTTHGLSADFCALNVLGFSCYTAYNVALFYSPTIRRLYHERYHHHQGEDENNNIPVQSNDVAFAVHALIVSSLTLFQIGYYDGLFHRSSQQQPSKVISIIIILMLTVALGLPVLIVLAGSGSGGSGSHNNNAKVEGGGGGGILFAAYFFFGHDDGVSSHFFNWLDYLYVLSSMKVMITLIKYTPQVVLNCRRQSTAGWSIWQILLDMTGGCLSDLQLVLDCAAIHDFTGITGNLPKLVLGSASIVFDLIFFLQHYVLYSNSATATTTAATTSLLSAGSNSHEQFVTVNNEDADDAGNDHDDEAPRTRMV